MKRNLSELKKYINFLDFVEFNEEFIESNPFLYFNLSRTIDRVLKGEVDLYRFFNVIDETNLACGLQIENECLLYASCISKSMIPLVAKGLEFNKFKRYHFFGTKNIIDSLFDTYNVQYSEQKHRIYYQCKKVAEPFKYCHGEITMGEFNRIPELIDLGTRFINEFYDEEKPEDNVEATIINGINKRNIFQCIVDDMLVGMAQVIYNDYEFPILGYVYTHPDFRGRGIASSITHKITKGLLDVGHEKCMLMTNAYNPISNRAFPKVGYEKVGEYVMRYKEK